MLVISPGLPKGNSSFFPLTSKDEHGDPHTLGSRSFSVSGSPAEKGGCPVGGTYPAAASPSGPRGVPCGIPPAGSLGFARIAGAIWGRDDQGHFQLQYQINLAEIGLDKISGPVLAMPNYFARPRNGTNPCGCLPTVARIVATANRRGQPDFLWPVVGPDPGGRQRSRPGGSLAGPLPRIADLASAARFLAELAGFAAAYLSQRTTSITCRNSSNCGRGWKPSRAVCTPVWIRERSPTRLPMRAASCWVAIR